MLGVQHLAINRVQDKIEHKHNNNNYLRIYKNNKYSREILMHGRSQACPILHADSPHCLFLLVFVCQFVLFCNVILPLPLYFCVFNHR